ncbi:MAG: hypothetical protein J0H14_26800 [Alphaproteobacteria bacterium]|nr:hypothetical protein [Alphaproteobacteria bacterium]
MTQPTIYKAGDKVRTTMAIGKRSIKILVNGGYAPDIFVPGSLGEVIRTIGPDIEIWIEDKATGKVARAILPLLERGKLEPFEHGRTWL